MVIKRKGSINLLGNSSPWHGYKFWYGLDVDPGLKDEWLERMNSIPGLSVVNSCEGHPGDTREWATFPNLQFSVKWPLLTVSEIYSALKGIAHVIYRDGSFFVSSKPPRSMMSESDYERWWESILSVLEELGIKGGGRNPTPEEIELEIAEAVSSEFKTHQKGNVLAFLREIETLNEATLYDVYKNALERQNIADLLITRYWFGFGLVNKALQLDDERFDRFVEGVVIPAID